MKKVLHLQELSLLYMKDQACPEEKSEPGVDGWEWNCNVSKVPGSKEKNTGMKRNESADRLQNSENIR